MRSVLVSVLMLVGCQAPPSSRDAAVDVGVDVGGDAGAPEVDAAGCTALLCVEQVFVHPGYNTVTSGVLWGGARGVSVVGSGGNSYPFRAWWSADAGTWALGALGSFGDALGPAVVAPLSADEYFVAHTFGITHVADAGTDLDVFERIVESSRCPVQADLFLRVTMKAAVMVSANEAWFAGWHGAVCKWSRDAGFADVPIADAGDDWSALLPLADGGVLLGSREGRVREYGAAQATQLFSAPITSVARVGDTLWAAGGTSTGEAGGGLKQFSPQSGWSSVDAGLVSVHSVWARSLSDVWIGDVRAGVAHFDGAQWKRVVVPGLPTGAKVSVVSGHGDQLFVGGSVANAGDVFEDAFAVILRRR